jgi:hypothetical protein
MNMPKTPQNTGFRVPRRHLLATFMLGLMFIHPALADQAINSLLATVADTYGARAPQAVRETGTTTSFRRGEGALMRQFKAPDRFRIDITYDTGAESRALVGSNAWQQGQAANAAMHGAIVLQAARLALPWSLLDKPAALVDLGAVSGPAGRIWRALELPMADGMRLIAEIDPVTGRMMRSRGIQTVMGATIEFATEYSDFTRNGEHLYAAAEQHYAMGQHIGRSHIQRIEYLDTLPDSAFGPR